MRHKEEVKGKVKDMFFRQKASKLGNKKKTKNQKITDKYTGISTTSLFKRKGSSTVTHNKNYYYKNGQFSSIYDC